jgi:hypothetical protein
MGNEDQEKEMEGQVYTDAFLFKKPVIKVRKFYRAGKDKLHRLDYTTIKIDFDGGIISIYLHNFTAEDFLEILRKAIINAENHEWEGEIK